MKKTELLTPEDKIIKKRIKFRKRKIYLQRKIIKCPCCGILNINKGNSHKCPDQWKLENIDYRA